MSRILHCSPDKIFPQEQLLYHNPHPLIGEIDNIVVFPLPVVEATVEEGDVTKS